MKDGEVTYKKFEVGQLMGSIQLGIHNSVGNLNTEVRMEMQILGQNIFSVIGLVLFLPVSATGNFMKKVLTLPVPSGIDR